MSEEVIIRSPSFGSILRHYASGLERGWSDTDLTRRQARLTAALLQIAANAVIYSPYPPTADERRRASSQMSDWMWSGGHVMRVLAKQADIDAAIDRAYQIVSNV